ncbi:cysteine--tRNA ligase [Desulfonema magnum]|uniref:Cysteine--tRNA ligase n=1 Tax=Desulfonema magnum TaxID=45655 RepID=A0A975GS41_9BACT|nr:cysteine--tRNA ligase [Desulfonema magnum]QTA91650.1 Cysteine--tRNA ligase [Desulfonema magnum]
MTIRVYNTLSRKKEDFNPIEPGKVKMYVCGPTVYDYCHIGHARSVVTFDVIARYFRYRGFEVTYVRNFTDVDDKIIRRANETGVDSREISEKFIREFYNDMDALNVGRADFEPKVTEYIEEIKDFVLKLIEKGNAYQTDGDVYYSVESFKEYGKLSGRKLEDMEAGARVDIDERKHNPFDFALWKSSKPGEPAWDSPWGKGRPGWHIECSAMSSKLLGETFDIHGGGKDLIFPHHENEIAQSEGAYEKPFARYWMHNGFININQEKMSKSLGNFLMIKDVLKSYHPETIRVFLLSNHYRSPIDFTDKAMDEASSGLDKIYALLERVETVTGMSPNEGGDPGKSGEYWNRFTEAMDDDFNTAKAIGVLFDAVRNINRTLDENSERLSDALKNTVHSERSDIVKMGRILGIFTESPKVYFEKKKRQGLEEKSIDPAGIDQLVRERSEARKAKNWARADEIRKQLEEMNIVLEDRPEGTVWRIEN